MPPGPTHARLACLALIAWAAFVSAAARAAGPDFADDVLVARPLGPRELGLELGSESRVDRDYRLQGWFSPEIEGGITRAWMVESRLSLVNRGHGGDLADTDERRRPRALDARSGEATAGWNDGDHGLSLRFVQFESITRLSPGGFQIYDLTFDPYGDGWLVGGRSGLAPFAAGTTGHGWTEWLTQIEPGEGGGGAETFITGNIMRAVFGVNGQSAYTVGFAEVLDPEGLSKNEASIYELMPRPAGETDLVDRDPTASRILGPRVGAESVRKPTPGATRLGAR
jgi:hypothetical protein